MNSARRAWRLPVAALSGALLGTGITAGALAQGPAAASSPPAPAGAAANTINSHAPVVRQVVPSMVLIRTRGGLGSGVILDGKGNIVTNAHATGQAASFQVQLAGDPAPGPRAWSAATAPMIWP
jgi:S1-C subfamily serine protease